MSIVHSEANRRRWAKYGRAASERFEAKIDKSAPNGCWNWTGGVDSNGYGNFANHKTNRYAFRLFKGEIPASLFVLHTCDNKRCVNPEHLYAGTHLQNMRDVVERGLAPTGETHCKFVKTKGLKNRVQDLLAAGCLKYKIAEWLHIDRSTLFDILKELV